MKFELAVSKKGELFIVPKEISIEKFPFAYKRDIPKGEPLDVDELVFPLPVKKKRKDIEEEWRKKYKERKKELSEERGYSEVETKSIGKERYDWEWKPSLTKIKEVV